MVSDDLPGYVVQLSFRTLVAILAELTLDRLPEEARSSRQGCSVRYSDPVEGAGAPFTVRLEYSWPTPAPRGGPCWTGSCTCPRYGRRTGNGVGRPEYFSDRPFGSSDSSNTRLASCACCPGVTGIGRPPASPRPSTRDVDFRPKDRPRRRWPGTPEGIALFCSGQQVLMRPKLRWASTDNGLPSLSARQTCSLLGLRTSARSRLRHNPGACANGRTGWLRRRPWWRSGP